MKRFLSALALIMLLCVPAFALSDGEYLKMKKDPAFKTADGHLSKAYSQAKTSMSKTAFEKLKDEQRQWVTDGRDKEAKSLIRDGYDKLDAYTQVTRRRACEIYSKIPLSAISFSASVNDFIGDYSDVNYLGLTVYKDNERKKTLCAAFGMARRNSADMFGYPRGNVLEVKFDSDDEDSMNLLKYEAGIDEDENLDLWAKLTMLNKDTIKVEASPDLNRLFDSVSGIFLRGE